MHFSINSEETVLQIFHWCYLLKLCFFNQNTPINMSLHTHYSDQNHMVMVGSFCCEYLRQCGEPIIHIWPLSPKSLREVQKCRWADPSKILSWWNHNFVGIKLWVFVATNLKFVVLYMNHLSPLDWHTIKFHASMCNQPVEIKPCSQLADDHTQWICVFRQIQLLILGPK